MVKWFHLKMGVCLLVCICVWWAPWLERYANEARSGAFPQVACQPLSFKGHIFIPDPRLLLHTCLLLANKEMRFEITHCLHLSPSWRKQLAAHNPCGWFYSITSPAMFLCLCKWTCLNIKTHALETVTNHGFDVDSSGERPLWNSELFISKISLNMAVDLLF